MGGIGSGPPGGKGCSGGTPPIEGGPPCPYPPGDGGCASEVPSIRTNIKKTKIKTILFFIKNLQNLCYFLYLH